jgi:outer membrane protein
LQQDVPESARVPFDNAQNSRAAARYPWPIMGFFAHRSACRFLRGCALGLLFCGALAAGPAAAQLAPERTVYKIGFVDTGRVMRESRASQQMQKSLSAEFETRQRSIEGGPKSEIAWRKGALHDDMNQQRDEAMKQIIDRTNGVIRRIAEAESYDAVFYEAAFVTPGVDLTARVIKALDAEKM